MLRYLSHLILTRFFGFVRVLIYILNLLLIQLRNQLRFKNQIA